MSVVLYHNPYDKASRDKLDELIAAGANVIIEKRTDSRQDDGWKLAGHISFLPTMVLHDDDGTELDRAEQVEHITKENVDWMHRAHEQWKKDGRRVPFPPHPWKKG